MLEQHINTFEKGMTRDVSVIYQPDGSYRYMKNCQLISQDGNNFTIKDCMGNVKLFTINTPYSGTIAALGTSPVPIGFISFPDKLIVFSTNNTTEDGGYGEIGYFNYKPYGEGYAPVDGATDANNGYIPIYHHASLAFTTLFQIEGFGVEENEAIKRIYWTDNFNQPRTINISDPIFSTYYTGTADLDTADERYMVVQGAVTYNAVNYGPGLAAGNVFTATVAGGNSYTDVSSPTIPPLVVRYFPFGQMDFNPSRILANIKFDSYGSGAVFCGSKIYFYRLKNTETGTETSWSYGSFPIHVGTQNTLPGPIANVYFDFAGGGHTALTNSTYSVNVNISEIDTDFDILELACAEYDESLNTPRQITIVNSVTITGTEMIVEHNGSLNLGDLTLTDVTLFPISIITCKTMTTNKNYILVGNITERQEYEFDNTGVVVGQTDYYMPVCDSTQGCTTGNFDFNWIGPNPNGNPVAGEILLGTKWRVSSAAGTGTATYNAVVYGDGDIFVGVAGVQVLGAIVGDAIVRPVVSYNKYTSINNFEERENYIQLKEVYNGAAYWNYKNPAVASHIKGYWNGEKYRFGILFYDKQGNPYYVRHLTDYTFREQNDVGISYVDATGGVKVVGLLAHGVTFSNIVLERELVENISGFSIVRAERDKRVLQQCSMWQLNADLSVPDSFAYYPAPLYDQATSTHAAHPSNATNKFFLISPDHNADFPSTEATTANYPYLERASWFAPITAYNYMAKEADNQFETQLFAGFYGTLGTADDNPVVINKIISIDSVDEAGYVGGIFGEFGSEFFNDCYVANPFAHINATCNGGALNTNLGGSVSRGGKKIVIEVEDTFRSYTLAAPGGDYSNLAWGQSYKANVNIVLDKSSFYGGDSDTSLANTLYIQCGHYQPINDTVIADVNNMGDVDLYTALTFNAVEVYGGDAYTCLVDYGLGLFDDSGTISPIGGVFATDRYYSNAVKFPCQLNANYDLRSGRTTAKNRMHTTTNGVAYDDAGEVRLEQFNYNDGYSSEGTSFAYAAQPVNFSFSDTFRTRIRFAGPKTNGESIDSFRSFLLNDYKDMDGQGGEINNLRTKDNRTVVWQNAMVSTVPILERQVVSGSSGDETVIGTGGVVDRFDSITSYFGNQHKWGLTSTEFGFVWFDMRRKGFVALDFNTGVAELSQINGLKGFFDEIFLENIYTSFVPDEYINSPDYDALSDRPLTGFGITGVYDPKFKMTYLTFKFKSRARSFGPGLIIDDVAKDFTIGYYHPTKMFVGFYDCTPGIWWNHNQLVLSANNPKNPTKYYGPNMHVTIFLVGDVIGDGTKTYLCTADGVVPTYVSPPSALLFTQVADWDELWIHNQPENDGTYSANAGDYQYNKFFGIAADNEVEFVINPKTQNQFNVQHMEQEGNNVNFTDLYIEAGTQTASDTSIPASSNFYRVIWDKITSSFPLSSTGRIVNSYLSVRWVKKNWTTNRAVMNGSVKILRYIRSFLTQKR